LDGDDHPLWKRLMHGRGKDPIDAKTAPAKKRPEVVDIHAVRGFQRYVVMKRTQKTKSFVETCSVAPSVAPTSGSSQMGLLSSQVASLQAGPSLPFPAMVRDGVQYSQATGGLLSHASPSHLVTAYHTNHNSDSRSSIEGSCNRFLDKICFPRGHYR
ncbi:hypothetical protein P692DRAFT_20833087, partial [Suillus brevipes Sb2]